MLLIMNNSKEIIGPIAKADHDLMEKGIHKLTKIFNMKDILRRSSLSNSTQFLKNKIPSNTVKDTLICKICEYSFSKIHSFLRQKYGMPWILRIVTWLCSWGIKYDVCKGSIDLFQSRIVDSIIDRFFDQQHICSGRFICQFSHYIELNPDDYARKLLEDKPNKTQIHQFHIKNEKNENKSYKILQIADLHTDFLYEEVNNI